MANSTTGGYNQSPSSANQGTTYYNMGSVAAINTQSGTTSNNSNSGSKTVNISTTGGYNQPTSSVNQGTTYYNMSANDMEKQYGYQYTDGKTYDGASSSGLFRGELSDLYKEDWENAKTSDGNWHFNEDNYISLINNINTLTGNLETIQNDISSIKVSFSSPEGQEVEGDVNTAFAATANHLGNLRSGIVGCGTWAQSRYARGIAYGLISENQVNKIGDLSVNIPGSNGVSIFSGVVYREAIENVGQVEYDKKYEYYISKRLFRRRGTYCC